MKSLKAKILLTVGIVVVVANFILGTVVLEKAESLMEAQLMDSLEESVHSAAESVAADNSKEFKALHTLAAIPDIRNPEVSLLEKSNVIYGTMSLDKDYIDVAVLDNKGMSYVNNGERLVSFAEREYFKTPFNKGQDYIQDPFVNKITNAMAVFYAVPVYDHNNKIINVLFCVVDGFKVSKVIAQHKAGNDRSAIVISRRTGTTIAAENREIVASENLVELAAADPKNKSYSDVLAKMMRGETGVAKYMYNGVEYICAYVPIADSDWVATCSVPTSDFKEKLVPLRIAVIIFVIVFALLSFIIVGLTVMRSIKPLNMVKDTIGEIASGNADLTKRISVETKDEVGAVVNGFNTFVGKLQTIMSQLKSSRNELSYAGENLVSSANETSASITEIISNIESVHEQITNQGNSVTETAGAVNEIASNIESLERMIETQSLGISQASSAVEEMIGNIRSVNSSVEKMASSFEELSSGATAGAEIQMNVNEKIEKIKIQSETLQEANIAISAIAAQTNLLAMNAAIEAAHAGEAGKGFSVVADEIRKLSETSSAQSKTIGEELTSIREAIESVVHASEESSRSFQNVAAKINETDELVRQIKAAMEEQTQGSQQINEALHGMNDSTAEVKNASREMSEGNKQILNEVKRLQDATDVMKVSMEEMSEGAKKINETGVVLSDISANMKNAIDKIGVEIDQFTV